MKKIRNLLFMGIMLFAFGLFVPNVNAVSSVKTFDNVNYFFRDDVIINPPAELGNCYAGGYMSDDKVLYIDGNNEEAYLVNSSGTYRKITLKELNEFYNAYEKRISYELKNNKIYKHLQYIQEGFIKSTDVSLEDDKYYYILDESSSSGLLGLSIKEDDSLSQDPTNYYNRVHLTLTGDKEINENTTYYVNNEDLPMSYDIVTNKVKDDLWKYFVLKTEGEYLFDFNLAEAEEVSGVDKEDLSIDSVFTFKGETYVAFSGSGTSGLIFYNKKGEHKDLFGHNGIYMMYFTKDFINISYVENEKYGYELYDKYGNLVLSGGEENIPLIDIIQIDDGTLYVSFATIEPSTVIKKIIAYKVIEGNMQTFNDNDLIIKFNGDLEKLSKLKVNDVELDSNNYTKTSGSTIITLKKDYLKTLPKGTYTLKAEYEDGGYVSSNFIISIENPQTNDGIINFILLGSISLIGLFGVSIYLKKKRFN